MKFKVGDKVKIVGWSESINAKKGCYGKVAEVVNVFPGSGYPYVLNNNHFGWRDEELTPVAKFKVGDKVRIIKNIWPNQRDSHGDMGIGDICNIIHCAPGSPYPYKLDKHRGYNWCDAELELVNSEPEYKIGDRVIIKESNIEDFHPHAGKIGFIYKIDWATKTPWKYLIEVDGGRIWCTVKGLAPTVEQKIVITTDGKTTTAKLYKDNKVIKTAEAKCSPEDTFDFNFGAKLAFERLTEKEDEKIEWRVVKRPVKVGDYIRLTTDVYSFDHVGDILKVDIVRGGSVGILEKNHPNANTGESSFQWNYRTDNYEVIEPVDTCYYNGKVICTANSYKFYNPLSFTVGKIYEVVNGTIITDSGCEVNNITNFEKLCCWTGTTFIPLVE